MCNYKPKQMHYNKVKIIIEKAGKRKGFDAANEL
jgi:hypothetical protein